MRIFRIVRILKAAANPTRYIILVRLISSPKGFSRLAEKVYGENVAAGRISGKFVYHLNVLKKARLIESHDGMRAITELGIRLLELTDALEDDGRWRRSYVS